MYIALKGRTSSSYPFAQFFLALATGICLWALHAATNPLHAATLQLYAATPPSNGDWPAQAHLHCHLDEDGTIQLQSLFEDLPGFEGFSDKLTLSPDRRTITYTLSGRISELPPDTDIAIITVIDPACGSPQYYRIRTDGIGTILILDEM